MVFRTRWILNSFKELLKLVSITKLESYGHTQY